MHRKSKEEVWKGEEVHFSELGVRRDWAAEWRRLVHRGWSRGRRGWGGSPALTRSERFELNNQAG